LSEEQLRAVCDRLRNFKPQPALANPSMMPSRNENISEIAKAWTTEEIEALVIIWSNLK
jgi:hypothetical protein